MKILDVNQERSQVSLDREELLMVNNALNEVCNGIHISEFGTRIGVDRGRAAALLSELGSLLDQMDLPTGLSKRGW